MSRVGKKPVIIPSGVTVEKSAKGGSASGGKNNEIVVVNPAVPRESKYLHIAKNSGAVGVT